MSIKLLRNLAILSFVIAMGVLLLGGYKAKDSVAPYPGKVVDENGTVLFTKQDILKGQDVYQRYGLMDHGSVWGHGSQRGMEFSAVTLHRWSQQTADSIAQQTYGLPYADLDNTQKLKVKADVQFHFKTNRYDADTDTLMLTSLQAAELSSIDAFWDKTFHTGDDRYGFLPDTVKTAPEREAISRFFTWTAWVASANRPGTDSSFTNNWPAEELVGNEPSADAYIWTIGGVLSLFLVLGLFVYFIHYYHLWYGPAKGVPLGEKLLDLPLTNSQAKAAKFFLVVILLFLVQTCFGGLLAHYTVHPSNFYLSVVAKYIPYSWAKSWHLQLAIFWIATTWVASAIYLGPIIGGREPRKQGILVQLLFVAILIVAVGSLTGQVFGIQGKLEDLWFWFGHQGWEYLELGRFWQILLFIGLIAWLVIVYRTISHHLLAKEKTHFNSLVVFYVLSAILVVAFFGFGLFYGQGTHMTVADYWRWFVVHIWVESIFEFFGVAAITIVLVVMGLASKKEALMVAYFTAIIVFLSGIIGTAHHYFWYGGPSYWLALGSVFSSMEPVPLFGIIVRALMEYKSVRKKGMDFPYKWPLYFLVASSFWNFLGAGVFGFLINLPIVNYYEHGTYLTMNHGHAALFGTYGMLSIALLLFSWRGLVKKEYWNEKLLKVSFWGMNVGLFLMTFLTLFPVGLVQVIRSYKHGLWMARDASFFELPFIKFLGQIRLIPDTIIIVLGVLPLVWFLFTTYRKLKPTEIKEDESIWEKIDFQP